MPQFITSDGCTIEYRIRGEGPLITLTPGGREHGEAVSALADVLATHASVLTWDRRNTGASGLSFSGELSEAELWAEDLADLIQSLGRGPAWLAGGSAGCRVSVITALRRPEIARGLLLWSASGGPYSCQFLGFLYHVPFIMAAERAGMEAVAQTPFFADRIAANPATHARLLSLDPVAFAADMKRLNHAFYYRPDCALAGVPDTALRTIQMPTLIFAGNDDVHPSSVSDAVAALIPNATLLASPWSTEEWLDKFTMRQPGTVFDLYPQLAPALLEFIGRAKSSTL